MIQLTEGFNTYKMSKQKNIWRWSFSLQAYIIQKIPPATKNLAYAQIRMG